MVRASDTTAAPAQAPYTPPAAGGPRSQLAVPGAVAAPASDVATLGEAVADEPLPGVAARGTAPARRPPGGLGPAAGLLCAYAVYQVMALAAWWHLLAGGLADRLPAGSADPAQEAWFLAWVPHALGSGVDPFFTHAVFAPAGANLLSNTSFELLGLLLAPVTLTAGPVAALDVAAILAPALAAAAAFALCRRYARWQPAAFVGGLCYGFGPFVATDLRYAHLDLTWLVLPPLILLVLDELVVRQRRRPSAVGAVLGLLVVAQFFVSTEMLAITAVTAALAVAVAAVSSRRCGTGGAPNRLRRAIPGLAVGLGVAAIALAYPLWVVVAGARHVTGAVWPNTGQIATTVLATVQPHAEVARVAFVSGGDGGYLGAGLLIVVVAGAIRYRRSVALRSAVVLAAAACVLSLGSALHLGTWSTRVPLPAAVLSHLPLLDSILPERFASMVDLFAGLALAMILCAVVAQPRAVATEAGTEPNPGPGDRGHPGPGTAVGAPCPIERRRHLARVTLAGALAVIAVAPVALEPTWPYATTTLHQPAILASVARGASEATNHPIVAVYPDSSGATADEMVWQAQDGFAFDLAGGYAIVPGAGGRAVESPPNDALWLVFAGASLGRLAMPLSATTRRSVRASLSEAGIRDVVVLPGATGSAVMRAALTSVLGQPRRRLGDGVLWVLAPRRRWRR